MAGGCRCTAVERSINPVRALVGFQSKRPDAAGTKAEASQRIGMAIERHKVRSILHTGGSHGSATSALLWIIDGWRIR